MPRGKKASKGPNAGTKKMSKFMTNYLKKDGKTAKAGEALRNPLEKRKRRERRQYDAKNFLDFVCQDVCENPDNADICFKKMTEVILGQEDGVDPEFAIQTQSKFVKHFLLTEDAEATSKYPRSYKRELDPLQMGLLFRYLHTALECSQEKMERHKRSDAYLTLVEHLVSLIEEITQKDGGLVSPRDIQILEYAFSVRLS
mmetsp:Transcript_15178/g.28883  ORF Transcript_15178/g.28883 Transcript_15178/m.28883 type:complete len:200 (-) Transcript_15178:32-631(-)